MSAAASISQIDRGVVSLRGRSASRATGPWPCRSAPSRACGAAARPMSATRRRGVQADHWLARAVVDALGRPIDGNGPLAGRARALSFPGRSAARPCPPPRRGAARSRRAGHQHLPDHLPRPAHGHLRGIGRRQVRAAVDAGALHGGRRRRHRPRRRARPRGAGVPAGRPRDRGPRPLGRRRGDLGRAGPDAPQRRLSDADASPNISATRARRCCA